MKKNYELLMILGNIFNCIQDNYLKSLFMALFKAIETNQIDKLNLEILNLFDYQYIKYEYHNIKSCIELLEEYFNINKYADIINPIRVNNGLGYDNKYLMNLFNELDKTKFNTIRKQGLLNLLSDNNLVYNNIGLRILIIKHLLGRDISKYKFIKLDNNRLKPEYRFMTFKNDKIKFYSKLYFINGFVFVSTLEHDNINNYVLISEKIDINDFYGETVVIDKDNQDLSNLKDYQYRYRDTELALLNMTHYLLYLVNKELDLRYIGEVITEYNNIQVTTDNLEKSFITLKSHYVDIIQFNDKMTELYDRIEQIRINSDEFKSNALDKKSIKAEEAEDYFKYDIKLSDYFLRP